MYLGHENKFIQTIFSILLPSTQPNKLHFLSSHFSTSATKHIEGKLKFFPSLRVSNLSIFSILPLFHLPTKRTLRVSKTILPQVDFFHIILFFKRNMIKNNLMSRISNNSSSSSKEFIKN